MWLNSNIKVGNQLYFIKALYGKSIWYLHDILDHDSKILNFVEFCRKEILQ